MLLGEPPPSPADVHFKLFGFPVRIHPFFWLITILFGIRSETAQQLIAWVIAVCIGVVVHELGHAFAWRIHGQHPWITLYGLGGLTSVRSADYGRRGGGSFAQIFISFAGPLAGFALAGLVIAVAYAAGTPIKWIHILSKVPFPVIGLQSEAAFFIVTDLLFVCYFWGIINLLPVYPLDGGQIARELFQLWHPREGIRYSLMLSVAAGGGVAVFALLQYREFYIAFMFGYLAYSSYVALRAYDGYRGW